MKLLSADPFFRGLLPGISWSQGSRLPAGVQAKLPTDTVRAARVPAGVHLAFMGDAQAVRLQIAVGDRTAVPAPAAADAFSLCIGDGSAHRVPLPGAGELILDLPERADDEVVRVYLPETVNVTVLGLEPQGGRLGPAQIQPRWVVYGDSITQGWSVTDPSLAWPAVLAQGLGVEAVNLGFAGSARGELMAAEAVGASDAQAVTVAWGTNSWSSLPADSRLIAETMRVFLTTIWQGLPGVRISVLSPLLRPDAEGRRNRHGATLEDLREAMEAAVGRLERAGEGQIELLSGLPLLPAERLPDGLHPDDAGHAVVAEAMRPLVARSLGVTSRC